MLLLRGNRSSKSRIGKEEKGREMALVSHRVERSDLVAGDHIYTYRAAYTYAHHGIYVGENKVVHFTQVQNFSGGFSSFTIFSSSVSVSNVQAACLDFRECGSRKRASGVIMSCLNCFLENGSLYRFEYGVSRLGFIASRGGTCTIAKSDPPETAIHRAMYLLQIGFGKYDLLKNNCEDFALYCKTECLVKPGAAVGGSGQASSAASVPVSTIVSLPLGLLNRYANDIGVRPDVIKVKVEDMAVFLGNRHG